MSSDELDPSFLEKVKNLFEHREVEIIVRDPLTDEIDAIMSDPEDYKRLLASIEQLKDPKTRIQIDPALLMSGLFSNRVFAEFVNAHLSIR